MSDLEFQVFDRESLHKARRRALLQEAGKQFAQKGFHGTSIADIAKGIKLTKSGLFHYIKTKEELLYLCYEDAIESAEQCMDGAEETEGDALDKLAHYVRNHLGRFGKPGGFFVILSELYVLNEDNQKKLRNRARKVDSRMMNMVQKGIDEGSIGYKNARMAVYAIEGALNWVPKWYSKDGKKDISEIVEAFIEFFVNGLRAR